MTSVRLSSSEMSRIRDRLQKWPDTKSASKMEIHPLSLKPGSWDQAVTDFMTEIESRQDHALQDFLGAMQSTSSALQAEVKPEIDISVLRRITEVLNLPEQFKSAWEEITYSVVGKVPSPELLQDLTDRLVKAGEEYTEKAQRLAGISSPLPVVDVDKWQKDVKQFSEFCRSLKKF